MKRLRYLLGLLLPLLASHLQGAYSIQVASQGQASRAVKPGEAFDLDVLLISDGSDSHNSAIFRLVVSAPGLLYESYHWSPPYNNGTSEDDSKPLVLQLPQRLGTNTLAGVGYPGGIVDVELSNVTGSQPGFGSGTLVRLGLSVPLDYAGPTNLSITVQPDSFARGFTSISTVAGAPFVLSIADSAPATIPLVPAGATWKYLDNGSNQSNAWVALSFDDHGWSNGVAELGYGDDDERTTISYGPEATNKYITTYFRHAFVLTNASSYSLLPLNLRVRRDDGIAVYLNGTEVLRDNLPSGTIGFDTLAAGAEDDGYDWIPGKFDPRLLLTGTNVLAAEIHQFDRTSSDISFDLELTTVGCDLRKLTFYRSGNTLLLLWPCAADGYRLQATTALIPPIQWSTVTNSPEVAGSLKYLLLGSISGNQFFRLVKP